MNYLREPDDLCARMAHNQAWIFQRASREGLPSYSFAKMYLCSEKVADLDRLILVSSEEIYIPIKEKIKRKGKVEDPSFMHWAGYVYRYLGYLYGVSSRVLFYKVPLRYLRHVYGPYHSLDIVKATNWIYKERLFTPESNLERAVAILREIR